MVNVISATGNPYAIAIETTRGAIVERACRYKRLVIVTSIGTIATLVSALLLKHPLPLLTFTLLPALVTAYFARDLRSVHCWRRGVLASWLAGTLQLDLLAKTLRQVPSMPTLTVEGMLECLPTWPGEQVTMPVRPALVEAQHWIGLQAERVLLARTVAWCLGAAVLFVAAITSQMVWLMVWALAPGIAIAWHAWSRRSARQAHAALRHGWQQVGVDDASGDGWLDGLSWQGVPALYVGYWRTLGPVGGPTVDRRRVRPAVAR